MHSCNCRLLKLKIKLSAIWLGTAECGIPVFEFCVRGWREGKDDVKEEERVKERRGGLDEVLRGGEEGGERRLGLGGRGG